MNETPTAVKPKQKTSNKKDNKWANLWCDHNQNRSDWMV